MKNNVADPPLFESTKSIIAEVADGDRPDYSVAM